MTNQSAIIIASTITVCGTCLTFLLNLFFNHSVNKRLAEEKFFYSVFEKRLELYNEFAEWLKNFPEDIRDFFNLDQKSSTALLEVFEKKHENALVYFELKARLLGDTIFADKCHTFTDTFLQEIHKQLGCSNVSMFDIVNLVVGISTDRAFDFIDDFSKESFPSFLDSFIKRYIDRAIPESKRRRIVNDLDEPNSEGNP